MCGIMRPIAPGTLLLICFVQIHGLPNLVPMFVPVFVCFEGPIKDVGGEAVVGEAVFNIGFFDFDIGFVAEVDAMFEGMANGLEMDEAGKMWIAV